MFQTLTLYASCYLKWFFFFYCVWGMFIWIEIIKVPYYFCCISVFSAINDEIKYQRINNFLSSYILFLKLDSPTIWSWDCEYCFILFFSFRMVVVLSWDNGQTACRRFSVSHAHLQHAGQKHQCNTTARSSPTSFIMYDPHTVMLLWGLLRGLILCSTDVIREQWVLLSF